VQVLIQTSYFENIGRRLSLDDVRDFGCFGEILFWDVAYEEEQEDCFELGVLGEVLEG
jgi:hypothetical protein